MNTPEAIRDLALMRFQALAAAKYDNGQREHGGLITDRDLLAELEREIIDAWFYLQGLRIKLEAINDTKNGGQRTGVDRGQSGEASTP